MLDSGVDRIFVLKLEVGKNEAEWNAV
jgi:hypothetical protein